MNQPFWTFSLNCYARPGVAEACLTLQDAHGLDVNLLLYALWLADRDQQLTPGHYQSLTEAVLPWHREVVAPLRQLRRQWRGKPAAAVLREQVKALELSAERQQQDSMWDFYQQAAELDSKAATAGTNLAIVGQYHRLDAQHWTELLAAVEATRTC
jgi:uncharacterized protein (TIGR02444 family)